MNNPYKELSSYTEIDAAQFKGRTAEIEEMYKSFYQNEYLVCYADSGEGKSSIIEAGLVPKLRQNIYLPIHIVFKSDRHFQNNDVDLDEVICAAIDEELDHIRNKNLNVSVEYPIRLSELDGAMAPWEKDLIDKSAWLRLRYTRINIETLIYTPVLIFDQFEEVFTNPSSQEWTDRFFAWLEELSADVFPQRIRETLLDKCGEDYFPEIYTQKGFKCIFSLRSEYMGKLDYWGMQRHFIPQLKNNRYLLRPLTIKGAKEVITQQKGYNGLDNVADRIISLLRSMQKGKNYVTDEASDLPCIPALFLSVICSQAFDMNDDQRGEFIAQLSMSKAGDKSSAIDGIIERFYEKTIAQCGIPQHDMDRIEDVLVNNEGNRQRVSSHTDALKVIDFSGKYLPILEKARIIRVIPEYNREDKSIELIHDSLCPVIQKKKEQRLKRIEEEARKLKIRNEDILCSAFLAGLFLAISALVYAILQVYHFWDVFEISKWLHKILFANTAVFPFLIIGAVKRLKQYSWLSLYCLVSNAILSFFFLSGQKEELALRIAIVVLAIVVPLATSVCAFKYRLFGRAPKSENEVIANSLPLLVFWLALSIFFFLLCVFNATVGLPEPLDSCWGFLVIPVLTHWVISRILHVKIRWSSFVPYCMLLGLLTFNSLYGSFPLPFIGLCAVLCGSVVALIGTYRGLPLMKRMACVSVETIILALLVGLNLGFNFTKINYDEVKKVYSWSEVVTKGNDGKLGIRMATNGDTIVPTIVDSINLYDWRIHLSSDKLQQKKDILSVDSSYQYIQKEGISLLKRYYLPRLEPFIFKLIHQPNQDDNSKEGKLLQCAAITFKEVQLASLNFFKTGHWFSLEDVGSLNETIKLQNDELNETLSQMDSTSVNDDNLLAFYRAFTRSLLLAMLQNRIIHKDSVHLYMLSYYLSIVYFYEYIPRNIHIEIKVKTDDYSKMIDVNRLNENSLERWYTFINYLSTLQLAFGIEQLMNEEVERIKHNNNILLQLAQEPHGNRIDSLIRNNAKDSNPGQKSAEVLAVLVSHVSQKLYEIAKNQTTMYEGALTDINTKLFMINMAHQYEQSDSLASHLEEMSNKKSKVLEMLKEYQTAKAESDATVELLTKLLQKDKKNK